MIQYVENRCRHVLEVFRHVNIARDSDYVMSGCCCFQLQYTATVMLQVTGPLGFKVAVGRNRRRVKCVQIR